MTTTKRYGSGAFVFSRARGLEPRLPEQVIAVALRHGLTAEDVPPYAGDHEAFRRAVTRVAVSVSRDGWMLRPIKKGRSSSEALYGIVRETRNETAERVDHEFEARVGWRAEPDPSVVSGDHFVARQVAREYDALRGRLVTDDWGKGIASVLARLGAAAVREDGRVYWCPPQHLAAVRKLGEFLTEVGIDLVIAEVEAEAVRVVEQVATTSLDEELERLAAEVDAFDGKQRPGTYELRLAQFQQLRQRANLYRDALGVGVERTQAVLNSLQTKVERMLDVRLNTRVKRDGTVVEGVAARRPQPAPTAEPAAPARAALVFGTTRYELADSSNGAAHYRPAGVTPTDTALLSALGRPVALGRDASLRAERAGEVVELVVEGEPVEAVAIHLRGYGIEVVK